MFNASEQWRPIPAWEGLYEVSDRGRVKSCARVISQVSRWGAPVERRWPEWIMQPVKVGNGLYLAVQLSDASEGRKALSRVSRLVLLAFVGQPPSAEHEAAHGNGDRHDNRLENLRWATPKENTSDKFVHGTVLARERNPAARITAEQVEELRRLYRQGGVRQVDLAARFGIAQTQVSRILRNESWAS